MKRRALFGLGCGAALALALPGQAQTHAARIGVLSSYGPEHPGAAASWSAFYARLASRGWVQGRNLDVLGRYAEGKPQRNAAFADELVAARVDLVVATNSDAVAAARRATSSIPIVMVNVSHPVEAGFVASLARPGGNVTGVTNQASDMQGKFIELLRAVRPETTRIGVVWSPDNAGSALAFKDAQAVARAQAVALLSLRVERVADLEPALASALRDGVQALIVHPTPAVVPSWRQIQAWAVAHRVVTLGQAQWVREGFLLSYWANTGELFRIGATFVDRILRGAAPAELPVEQPTRFDLVVNLRTAKAIGLTIPPSLLLRADEVIR